MYSVSRKKPYQLEAVKENFLTSKVFQFGKASQDMSFQQGLIPLMGGGGQLAVGRGHWTGGTCQRHTSSPVSLDTKSMRKVCR
jgi:hypothetical protein